ncbi:PE family protein [Mycobacterium sp. 1245111.1]|uniref:PE family protein n=1 Tax=Mycobacterium sp. 1245111.1 TaxID=1834073 RepID=UPI00080143BB|nr:PE family protein [Mycobacterium sp. 1245111.1]OBK31890.1 PE family protein [Mycobacterium sp. 1245111.1]
MSFLSIVPETVSAAADILQSVGSRIQAQNTAALVPTAGLIPAASDEVSALTAMQFAAHARAYQAVSAQAAVIHEMFVSMLSAGSESYAATEIDNAVATG